MLRSTSCLQKLLQQNVKKFTVVSCKSTEDILVTSNDFHHDNHMRMLHHTCWTQKDLPRLPVPRLEQTMNKFLLSARTVCNDDDFKTAQKLVADFTKKGGDGEKLQIVLLRRAETEISWFSDWWLKAAYLQRRTPIAIHYNPGVRLPVQDFKDKSAQLRSAARLILGVLSLKASIDDVSLPVEHVGKDPLCMNQYFSMLSTCRIPGETEDDIVTYPGGLPHSPTHIVVAHNNQFFKLDVYGEDGRHLTESQLEEQLGKIMAASLTPGPQIGILTSDMRDRWARTYKMLIQDEENKRNLEVINSSICLLCLDGTSWTGMSKAEMNTHTLGLVNHGLGSRNHSGNRWFDKTVQFIVGSQGQMGVNYEHAPAEGPPVLALVEQAYKFFLRDDLPSTPAEGVPEPEMLEFNLNHDITQAIGVAADHIDSIIDDLIMKEHEFDLYGKNFIKSQKMSPDSFLQNAMQLAYHRLYKHTPPTYESGSTRRFRLGRTDNIRSNTLASVAFCRAMEDPNSTAQEKAHKLQEAVQAHREYSTEVAKGHGIDRHLLGLKIAAEKTMNKIPPFLESDIYNNMYKFLLSTSQVPSKTGAVTCYGPGILDDNSLCYNPMDETIKFMVSTWKSSKTSSNENMINHFCEALKDCEKMLIKAS